jgi:hypothetical protein
MIRSDYVALFYAIVQSLVPQVPQVPQVHLVCRRGLRRLQ